MDIPFLSRIAAAKNNWRRRIDRGFKPQLFDAGLSGYGYNAHLPDGQRLFLTFLSAPGFPAARRVVTDPGEAKAYVDFSLTGTVGVSPLALGSISGLENDDYFGDSHSAEWNLNIQNLTGFYNRLIVRLNL